MRDEYRFVSLEGPSLHHLSGPPRRRTIEEHAAEGWRLVQVLRSAEQRRHANDLELVFGHPVASDAESAGGSEAGAPRGSCAGRSLRATGRSAC